MIGSDKPVSLTRSGWLSRLSQGVHHYIGVDGGTGANLLADLAGRDPYLQQVSSPRHADLLLVIEPISQKLAPAVVMMASALAHPARVLLIGESQVERTLLSENSFVQLDGLFPNAHRVPSLSINQIVNAVFDAKRWSDRPQTPDCFHQHQSYGLRLARGCAVAASLSANPADRAAAASGAAYQLIAYGLVTSVLFFLVGMLADRTGTREISRL